jgi:hypothetical protein
MELRRKLKNSLKIVGIFSEFLYLYYESEKLSERRWGISQDVARGLTNMVRTDLRTLLESLNEEKSNNWNDLSGKVSWILHVTDSEVTYLSNGVSLLINDRTWQQNITPTLYAFWNYFHNDVESIFHEEQKQRYGKPVDTKKLEEIRLRLEKHKFSRARQSQFG